MYVRQKFICTINDKPIFTGTNFEARIGQVTLAIVHGNIAKEKVGAVVNSTGKNLDLSKGLISSSIYMAAGDTVQLECDVRGM